MIQSLTLEQAYKLASKGFVVQVKNGKVKISFEERG